MESQDIWLFHKGDLHCVSTFHPLKSPSQKELVTPPDAGKQLWCCTTLTATPLRNEKRKLEGERIKKKEKKHSCDHLELLGHLGISVLQSRAHTSRLNEAIK